MLRLLTVSALVCSVTAPAFAQPARKVQRTRNVAQEEARDVAEEVAEDVADSPRRSGQAKESNLSPINVEVTLLKVQHKGEGILASGKPGDEISDALRKIRNEGDVKLWQTLRLQTVGNQQTMVQVGSRVPVVTGVSSNSRFGTQRQIQYQEVGTIVSVTAKEVTGKNEIVMQIQVEKSYLEDSGEIIGEEENKNPITVPATNQVTAQTTLTVPQGGTVLVGGSSSTTNGKTEELIILVKANSKK